MIKGLKRRGNLIINEEDWKLKYNGIEDIDKAQEFLTVVHYFENK